MHKLAHPFFRFMQLVELKIQHIVRQPVIDLQRFFKESQIDITRRARTERSSRYGKRSVASHATMAKDITRGTKTKDQLPVSVPLPVNLYHTTRQEVNA